MWKLCLICGENKSIEAFHHDRSRKDGRFPYCKKCKKTPFAKRVGLAKHQAAESTKPIMPPPSTKTCYRCSETKVREEFHNDKRRPDGKYPICAKCYNTDGKKRAQKRREEKERLAGPQDPKTKVCPCCGQRKPLEGFYTSPYSLTGRNSHCIACIRTKAKLRYRTETAYREKAIKSSKEQKLHDKQQGIDRKREWKARYPDRAKASNRRQQERAMSTPQGRIEKRVLTIVRATVRYRAGLCQQPTDWTGVLGYSFDDLKIRLETLFTEGMTWDRLAAGDIEIDHIIPRCAFHYETVEDEDFRRCWALSNLQPLWVKDNAAKGDRMPDGTSGREIGETKRRMLDEELSVAGWELLHKGSEDDIVG